MSIESQNVGRTCCKSLASFHHGQMQKPRVSITLYCTFALSCDKPSWKTSYVAPHCRRDQDDKWLVWNNVRIQSRPRPAFACKTMINLTFVAQLWNWFFLSSGRNRRVCDVFAWWRSDAVFRPPPNGRVLSAEPGHSLAQVQAIADSILNLCLSLLPQDYLPPATDTKCF